MNTPSITPLFHSRSPDSLRHNEWDQVSYAGVFIFTKSWKLVCIKQNRGIDIPWGHRDPGESPLEALRRESLEEMGYSIGDSQMVMIREGIQEYRGMSKPKIVYSLVEDANEDEIRAKFDQRWATHAHEASEVVFLEPDEFIRLYAVGRENLAFIENMRVWLKAALDARWKKLTVWLSALGDHQIRWHLFPLEVDTRVGDILVFDPDRQKAISKLREHGVDFENAPWKIRSIDTIFESIVGDPAICAAFVSSPDQYHIAQTRALLQAGKHVFCEKPLLHTLSEVPALVENILLAEQKWLILSSCHPRRFDRPFLWLKRYISEPNPLGKIQSVHFDFHYPVPEEGKDGLHSGLLADHFNHEIDLVHFYLGFSHFDAEKISDSQESYEVRWTREDVVTFHFHGERNRPRWANYAESIMIVGETGAITVNVETGEATLSQNGASTVLARGLQTDYVWRFQATTSNFIDAIVAGGRSYLTPEDLLINNLSWVVLVEEGRFSSRKYGELIERVGKWV